MKQDKQSIKLSIREQTKKFQTQILITIEHDFFMMYPQLKLFCIIIGHLQVVSFLVTPNRSNQQLINTMDNSINQYMNLIPLVTRPYTFITEVGGQAYNGEFRQFLFLNVLAWILLIMIVFIIMQIYFKQSDRKQKHLTISERIQQFPYPILIVIYMISWSLQMLNVILIVPAIEICLESFAFSRDLISQNSNQDQGQNYVISFLSIFTVILLFGINILRFFITEETITLSMRGYEKLNLTVLEMILFILKSGQVFIFIFVSDNSIALYLQIIIAICISITTIFNLLILHSQWNSRQIEAILITYCFNISMILVYLVTQITQIPQNQFVASMILLNFGFMASLILKYKIELELTNLQSKYLKKIDDPALLQFQIAQNLLCQYYSQTTKGILIQTIILTKHRQICEDVDCFCRRVDFQFEDPLRITFSNDMIQKEYTLVLLKKLNKCQKKIKNDYDKFSFTLHYIAALSLIGMNTQAFQQTNIVLFKSKINKLNVQDDSNIENSEAMSGTKSQSDQYRENLNVKIINERQRKQLKSIQVTNIKNLNFIQIQKLKILQTKIQLKIDQNVTSNNQKKGDTEELSHAVSLFLDSENNNQKLKFKVFKLMQMKLQFYDFLTSSKVIDGGIIFKKSQIISQKLYSTELNLLKLYQDFPSQKIQSVISFFQAEIFNNYLEAYKIASVTKIADDKLMKMNRNLAINLFSNKITFMILSLEDQNLTIQQTSNNAHEFFQYNQSEFRNQPNISFLLPPAIKKEHHILVNEFLQTGKSKFFRNQSLNFCIRKDRFITPVDFFYDINFSNLGSFSFAAFFEQITYTSAYIMIDLNGFVGGVTRNLFEKMGFKNSDIKLFDVQNIMYYTHITKILPQFNELVDVNTSKDHQIQNSNHIQSYKYADISSQFLNLEVLKKSFLKKNTIITEQPRQKLVIASISHIWSQNRNLQEYQLSCIINVDALVGMRYYIIEIEEIKQIKNIRSMNKTGTHQQSNLNTQYASVDSRWCHPQKYLNDDQLQQRESPEQDQENRSNLIEPVDVQKSFVFPTDNDVSIEKEIIAPNFLDLDLARNLQVLINNNLISQDMIQNEDCEDQQKLKLILDELKGTPNLSISGIILKPKDEDQVILDNGLKQRNSKQNMLMMIQQKFYRNDKSQSYEYSSKLDSSVLDNKKLNQVVQYDVQGIDEEFKQNILQMLQKEKSQDKIKAKQGGSQDSSINGVRKSPFFKKYDMLVKVVNSKNNPSQIVAMNTFLALKLILVFIFSIIIKKEIENDLGKFLEEIDILQITNYFLAPNVQFTVERLAIYRYDGQFAQGLISAQTHNQLVPFVQDQVISDYDTMKDNYVLQFSNVYLQGFFKDQYIGILQGLNNSNVTQAYNLTLRQALELLLENVYLFKLSYQGITSRAVLYKGPAFYYQYKNIVPLMNKFEVLSQQILVYTTQSTLMIQQKWYKIWLPFFILAILFTLLAWVCYKMYYRKLEQLMTMFKYVTSQSIERDKDRYKLLLNFLMRDSNLIFKYQFILEQKEKILYSLKQRKGDNQKQNQKNLNVQTEKKLQSLKLPILKSIVIFSSMLSIFVVTSTIINVETQIYLNKYSQTATLFKQFSDVGFYLPNLFLSRETLYNWPIVNLFLNSDDKEAIYNQINLSYQNIQAFISLMNFFNPYKLIYPIIRDLYLLTDTFIQQFQDVKTQSLCNFLEPNLILSSQYYCQNSFQGVLQRGLVITLDTIQVHFHTEQQVNNFTVRSDMSNLQIEAEFITQKVTELLKTDLKIGLVSLTQNHIAYVQNLCIFLIICSLVGVIFIFTSLLRRLRYEYMILKRVILLMPTTSLFFDDQFERQVRLILVKENIV